MDPILPLPPFHLHLPEKPDRNQKRLERNTLHNTLDHPRHCPVRPDSLRNLQTPVPPSPSDTSPRLSRLSRHCLQPKRRQIRFHIQPCSQRLRLSRFHSPVIQKPPLDPHNATLCTTHRLLAHLPRTAFHFRRSRRSARRNTHGLRRIPNIPPKSQSRPLSPVENQPALCDLRGQYSYFMPLSTIFSP